jgi:hypothetical protein
MSQVTPEPVSFLTIENSKDLIVSFAVALDRRRASSPHPDRSRAGGDHDHGAPALCPRRFPRRSGGDAGRAQGAAEDELRPQLRVGFHRLKTCDDGGAGISSIDRVRGDP